MSNLEVEKQPSPRERMEQWKLAAQTAIDSFIKGDDRSPVPASLIGPCEQGRYLESRLGVPEIDEDFLFGVAATAFRETVELNQVRGGSA